MSNRTLKFNSNTDTPTLSLAAARTMLLRHQTKHVTKLRIKCRIFNNWLDAYAPLELEFSDAYHQARIRFNVRVRCILHKKTPCSEDVALVYEAMNTLFDLVKAETEKIAKKTAVKEAEARLTSENERAKRIMSLLTYRRQR